MLFNKFNELFSRAVHLILAARTVFDAIAAVNGRNATAPTLKPVRFLAVNYATCSLVTIQFVS